MITAIVNMSEFKKLYEFCKSMQEIYIYGTGKTQLAVQKALRLSGIEVECIANLSSFKKQFKLFTFKKKGLILCESGQEIKKEALKKGFKYIFKIPELVVEQIVKKVTPRYNAFNFEINIVDHCNLNCQCCDHYSPLVKREKYLAIEDYEKYLKRLQELFGTNNEKCHVVIQLTGGEPTLHPELPDFLRLSRKYFPDGHVGLVTNGIKLLDWEYNDKGNLWNVMKENNIFLFVTTYPLKLNFEAIDNKAKEYGLLYARYSDIGNSNTYLANIDDPAKIKKVSTNHIFSLDGKNVLPYEFLSCYQFNESGCLKDGNIYQCPLTAHLNYFNERFNTKLKLSDRDFINIFEVKSGKEIIDFYSNKIPFCENCDIKSRYGKDFQISKQKISEWARIENMERN